MSEANSDTDELAATDVAVSGRRAQRDDLGTESFPGRPDSELDVGAGTTPAGTYAPPVAKPDGDSGSVSEPEDAIEIGGDNSCECSGAPDLAVDKDRVGEWRVQLVSCEACGYLFGSAVESGGDDRRAMGDE